MKTELRPSLGMIVELPDLPEPEKLTTEIAEQSLKQLVSIDQQLTGFSTTVRMAIGRLLLAIKDAGLHLDMGYSNWQAFLEEGIPKLCKRQWRFAYSSISMAQSKALAALEPAELEKVPVTNAQTLVRIEKAGTPVTRILIKKAKSLPSREFNREVGVTQGRSVSTWTPTKEQGTELQRIMDILRSGSGDALQKLADLFESVEMTREAGDGVDNKIDLLLSTMQQHFQAEEVLQSMCSPEEAAIRIAHRQEPAEDAEWSDVPTCP